MRSMEPITLKRLSLLMVLMYLHPKSGHSLLITVPRDTEVLINHSTYFNCSTSILSEQIHWYHNHVGENRTNYVYYKGQFNQIYADRYSIDIDNKTGEYNLIIRSVKLGDAGRYVCQDDGGLGDSSSVELIVSESKPTCLFSMKPDGFVGPNSCHLPLETMKLSCSVSYIGNIHPILQWKVDGNEAPILEGITTDYSGKRATMNLTMNSSVEMDGDVFTCGATRSHDKKLSCTTNAVKINYAVGQATVKNITKGDTITCSANSTVPCTYKWFYGNDTLCPVSCNQVLTTHLLGNHSCEATCPINGISCTFVAMRIIAFEDEISTASEESSKALLIAIGLLVPTVVVLVITTCILFFIARKAKSENTELKNKNSVSLEANLPSSGPGQQPAITAVDEASEPNANPSKDDEVEKQSLLRTGTLLTNRTSVDNGLEKETFASDTSIFKTTSKETKIHVITEDSKEWGRAIAGVAQLQNLVYIVIDNSSDVVTYDNTLTLKNRIPLKELENPWDLTSCKINKCLYVMDRSSTTTNHVISFCIDTYVSLVRFRVLYKWSTDTEYGNLSVASDGNVIVTFCDSRRLVIYGSDGTKIKDIPLSVDLINPTHALKLRNRQFLICHGINNDNIHRVCILNENFDIVNSFGRLEAPSYLAVDESGSILVADQGGNRVCVLDSDLTLKKEVVTEMNELKLRGPQRICLHVMAGKLLVADNDISDIPRRDGRLLSLTYDYKSQ